ncbi:hypothetical protein AA313_de0202663 [Arthrobotrys entomopaga]|nr:hypothetical protein AA313_de0202663 [Arthrobotrys entomopaga]
MGPVSRSRWVSFFPLKPNLTYLSTPQITHPQKIQPHPKKFSSFNIEFFFFFFKISHLEGKRIEYISINFTIWIDHSSLDLRSDWHPLVRTVSVARRTASQQRDSYASHGMRCYVSEIGDYNHLVPYSIYPIHLLEDFGAGYYRAITRIHLNGCDIGLIGGMNRLDWIFRCSNLREISLRWCEGITLDELVVLFLDEKYHKEWNVPVLYRQQHKGQKIPRLLKQLKFWGITNTRGLAAPTIDSFGRVIPEGYVLEKKKCDKLMERYETDVEWCGSAVHQAGNNNNNNNNGNGNNNNNNWAQRRLVDTMDLRCSACERVFKAKCLTCDMKNVCDRCLGYICNGCLIGGVFELPGVEQTEQANWHVIRDVGESSAHPSAPNMIEYRCRGTKCNWRENRHYFHPSCLPLDNHICSHCKLLFCSGTKSRCEFCGAGRLCCSPDVSRFCVACRVMVCRCGRCRTEEHTETHKEGTMVDMYYTTSGFY